ncbi:MAG: Lhr family helicase, partial [Candidatus Binataceae bacterium]
AAVPDALRAVHSGDRRDLRRDARLSARLKSSVAGRWSAIARPRPDAVSGFDKARELAVLLLERNGILTREMLALESLAVSWHELSFALRRMEFAGTIRRGWYVRSLSGEQYALPEAVDALRAARAINPARERPIALAAVDPANPYGAMLPGCAVTRDAANVVVLRAGRFVLGWASRELVSAEGLDDDAFGAAVAALCAARAKVVIETIDGTPALKSARVGLLASMRFHSDGRALVFDGLHGPTPARAGARV